jgi:O-succinylbenzoate synthase
MIEIPFLDAVSTARGVHRRRRLVMVQVIGEMDGRQIEGWGECAALDDTTYDREDAGMAFRALSNSLVPRLMATCSRAGGRLAMPNGLDRADLGGSEYPLSFSALEMAVADAHLRAERRSFAAVLGVVGSSVRPGAVVGTTGSVGMLVAKVKALAEKGYTRVKVKIRPGWDVEPLQALVSAVPSVRFQADANEAYGPSDQDHLVGLDRFDLLCLEQPLDRNDLGGHAGLAARMRTPICLDESLVSPASVSAALDLGACSVVCVKPARLGGIGSALQVIEECAGRGVPLWMGGMFEGGFGRGVNLTLAALPGFSWPGDLSPARSYLADDLVAAAGRAGDRPGLGTSLPTADGFGPPPDGQALERLTSDKVCLELARAEDARRDR